MKPILWFFAIAIACACSNLSAQDTLYSENFTGYTDGAVSGSGSPPKWTATNPSSDDYFSVQTVSGNKVFAGKEVDGEGVWTSQWIDIRCHTGVSLSVVLSEEGDQNSDDYIRVYYSLNGGAEILFAANGNMTNDFTGPITALQTGLNGDSVRVVIRINNDDNDEIHRFDDVLARGTRGGVKASISVTNSFSCSGSSGELAASGLCGDEPYTYAWSNGSASALLTGLAAGTYSVTVTDENGSTASASITAPAGCNPDMTASCPLDIVFVLDESGSIVGQGGGGVVNINAQVRSASSVLVNALNSGNSIRLAVVEFNTTARTAVIGGLAGYQTVNAAYVTAFNNYISAATDAAGANTDHYDPEDYAPAQYATNWEDAFEEVNTLNSTIQADLVIFFTDGMPTAYNNNSGGVSTGNDAQSLAEGAAAANVVKAQGSHVFVLGLPNTVLPVANVQAISGPDEYPVPEGNFSEGDYTISSSSQLVNDVTDIAGLICRADLRLTKSVDDNLACAGQFVVFSLVVTNDGLENASGVEVKDYLPSGFTYVSNDGGAAFAGSTLTWNTGTLNNSESKTLKITALVNSSGNYTNVAEVTASSHSDNDSDPNNYNGAPLEDDEATVTVSVTPAACLCDDGNACTFDGFQNGECVFTAIDCSDSNPCTADVCDPATGCTNPPVNCDDGNPQTIDLCENGTCTHTCDDNNVCTADTYNGVSCVFTPLSCSDGDFCTVDNCNPATGCFSTPVNCDDGNPQSADNCVNGVCTHTCNDGNACTNDSYSNATGNCIFTPVNCNDGNACTTDGCSPATGCTFTPINCDDGNPNTGDNCVNGICTHTCDDGNACTANITNANGTCSFPPVSCDDRSECTTDACNPATGCTFTPNNCDDGNPQTPDQCVNGVCIHLCNDGNSCTTDSYANGECVFTPMSCDDGEVCTADNCVNGNCQSVPFCQDNNPCTVDVCRPPVPSCVFVPVDCNDNDFCTLDACNSSNGNCVYTPRICNDGLDCTDDRCEFACIYEPVTCDTINPDLDVACPPRMIIIMDESGTIAGFGQGSVGVTTELRNGLTGMFNAISQTNIQVAVVEFNTRARRAVIGGTTGFQPVNGNLSDFLDYANDNNTSDDDNHFDPEDYLSNTANAFTNWEDALKMVQTINLSEGVAPLVLFFTDGMPTAYNNINGTVTTGTGSSTIAQALSKAASMSTVVKAQGSHLFVVAFPNPNLPEGNIQTITGPNRYPDIEPDFTVADYSIETSASLENSLISIANLLCRADLRLSMTATPSNPCAGETVTFTLRVTNDGLDEADIVEVMNYIPTGFTYVSDNGGAATTLNGNTLTWNAGPLLNAQFKTLSIEMLVNASGNYTNVAEVTESNKPDNDSDTQNFSGTPDEDDEAAASISFTSCSDGNACTIDICVNGNCVNTPVNCDDNNACSTDQCVNGNCEHGAVNCNDNEVCTVDDCNAATGCTHTPFVCNDNSVCTTDNCVAGSGCVYTAINCSDNDACTTDGCNAQTGCTHTATNCNDNNACTTDECSAQTGCTNVPVPNCCTTNANCNDSNLCTSDICSNGFCSNTAVNCNDNNACTADDCSPAAGCANTAISCNDNNACTNDGCVPATGCTNAAINCNDNNACTSDGCSPATGCTNTGINCNDNNACTNDGCSPSTGCTNTTVNCDDNLACTTDECNNQTGCTHAAIPNCCTTNANCNDSNLCTTDICNSGTCANTSINCNDNNACTTDECNAQTGCTYAAIPNCCTTNANCNDSNLCTTDICNNGTCANTSINCNDNNACTADGCNPQTGCTNTQVAGCCTSATQCNDNNTCTNDACVSNICSNTQIPGCGEPCTLSVVSLTLVNSGTDLDIRQLNNTDTINLAVTPNVNLRANTCPQTIGSVKFTQNGSQARIESTAPYSIAGDASGDYAKWNIATGLYTISAIPYSGSGATGTAGTAKTISLRVINQTVAGCTSNSQCNDNNACTVDACSNSACSNTPINCNDNNPCTTDACVGGTCAFTPVSNEPSYLRIVNPAKSWRKLKLGYSSTGLYSPTQNVTAGGNNQLCITLRSVGAPEWNKMQIRPQGGSSAAVTLSNYITGSVSNFTTFCIPLSAFTGYNFNSISYMEMPYSNGANAFEIHLAKVEFTGGSSPFLWFGAGHTNNYHDGGSGSSSALQATLVPGTPCGGVPKMDNENTAALLSYNSEEATLNAYPNPFSENVTITFSAPNAERVRIEILSVDGRLISTLFEGTMNGREEYAVEFHSSNLAGGMYFYRMLTESGVIENRKLLLVR